MAHNTANQDVELADLPTDSVSSLVFSGQADHLAVGSWDNSVRIYEVVNSQGQNIQSQGRAMYTHNGPVLSVCWNQDGTQIFSGSTDKTARIYDIASGQSMQVAQHTEPVKTVKFFVHPQSHSGILVTGSWDKTLKYWDIRSPTGQPIYNVTLPDKVYAFDVKYPYLVVGTASSIPRSSSFNSSNDAAVKPIHVFHLDNPTVPYKSIASPLKKQMRALACFNGIKGTSIGPGSYRPQNAGAGQIDNGYVVGSVEGRVAIQYIEDRDSSKNYSFKCHRQDTAPNSRDQALVYAINDLAFHPVTKALATCGSDGVCNFWNLENRTRLKIFSTAGLANTNTGTSTSATTPFAPSSSFNVNSTFASGGLSQTTSGTNSGSGNPSVTTNAFNVSGNIFAYAVSYDWHKGYTGNTPGYPNKVFLKMIGQEDVMPASRRR